MLEKLRRRLLTIVVDCSPYTPYMAITILLIVLLATS